MYLHTLQKAATLMFFSFAASAPSPATNLLGIQVSSYGTEGVKCTPATFEPLLPSGSRVLFAAAVAANGTFTEDATNAGQLVTVTGVPGLCAAKFSIPTSNSSAVDFAVFLPNEWNHRLMAVGNGGFGGYINWADMAQYSHYGFVAMSTNTGHYSGAVEASWALNKPDSIIDWGHRAVHESTVLTKTIIAAYYETESRYNYFSSCSNGGRQGLKELTTYPTDYDGIINGAPAWWLTHLFLWMAKIQKTNSEDETGYLSNVQLERVTSEILSQCDVQDSVKDGIISTSRGCDFTPEALLCGANTSLNSSECITSPQLSTLNHILNDWVDTNQTFVHPTLDLGANYVLANPEAVLYGISFLQNFVYNTTTYSIEDFDFLNTIRFADSVVGDTLNANFEVEDFRARGGKLLQYHGLADELIPSGDSIYWYSQLKQRLEPQGLSVDDWYRLFLVPGMSHCASSEYNAPWYFAAALHQQAVEGVTYSTPGFMDSKHDVTLAMIDWVEKGIAPTDIIATGFMNNDASIGVEKQRPLCPYPQIAKYNDMGDINDAESWSCSDWPTRSQKKNVEALSH